MATIPRAGEAIDTGVVTDQPTSATLEPAALTVLAHVEQAQEMDRVGSDDVPDDEGELAKH